MKAAFLFNFTRFVEWPETSFQSDGSPFVIGIVGKDPFGETIDQTIAGESVNGHPIIIQRYKDWNSLRNCHILFVSARQLPDIKRRLRQLKGRPMLTVSDHPGFITYGGMIRFLLDNNKIKIQINPAAARAESLNISSKLLRLADIAEARQ